MNFHLIFFILILFIAFPPLFPAFSPHPPHSLHSPHSQPYCLHSHTYSPHSPYSVPRLPILAFTDSHSLVCIVHTQITRFVTAKNSYPKRIACHAMPTQCGQRHQWHIQNPVGYLRWRYLRKNSILDMRPCSEAEELIVVNYSSEELIILNY